VAESVFQYLRKATSSEAYFSTWQNCCFVDYICDRGCNSSDCKITVILYMMWGYTISPSRRLQSLWSFMLFCLRTDLSFSSMAFGHTFLTGPVCYLP